MWCVIYKNFDDRVLIIHIIKYSISVIVIYIRLFGEAINLVYSIVWQKYPDANNIIKILYGHYSKMAAKELKLQ